MINILTSFKVELKELFKDGRWKVLLVVSLPWALLIGFRMTLPVLLPYIQVEFDMNLAVAGQLVTLLWLCGAVGQLPGGILTDKYGTSLLMIISLTGVALSFTLLVSASDKMALFFSVAMWGLAHSLYPIARISMLSQVYPDRLGSALGLTMATGDFGQTVLPSTVGIIAIVLAWQFGFILAIPILVLACIGIWVVSHNSLPTTTPVDAESDPSLQKVFTELHDRTMLFVIFILFLYLLLWQAFTAFYPTYLIVEKGLSHTQASLVFGLFFAAGAIFKPLGGAAHDKIGLRWSIILIFITPIIGLFILPFIKSVILIIIVTVLISSMLGNGSITQSFLADRFSPEVQGTGLGVVRMTTSVLGASGPIIFGVVAERGLFDQAYIGLSFLLIIIIFITYNISFD